MQLSPELEHRLLIAASIVTAALCGMAANQLWMSHILSKTKAFSLVPDVRPKVCTVIVDGIRDGNIEGTLTGSGRVFIGDVQALPDRDGSFSVSADTFLTQKITVAVPPGSQFVASKKGSKYYPLKSTSGQKIAPANRVYFRSREEAAAAGYHP